MDGIANDVGCPIFRQTIRFLNMLGTRSLVLALLHWKTLSSVAERRNQIIHISQQDLTLFGTQCILSAYHAGKYGKYLQVSQVMNGQSWFLARSTFGGSTRNVLMGFIFGVEKTSKCLGCGVNGVMKGEILVW